MNRSALFLLVVAILFRATAEAHGGTVQFRKEAGDLVITVFTSTAALSVGPTEISLFLQKLNDLEPVLDAKVSLVVREASSDNGTQVQATREQAWNKLLYAAPVTFDKPGKWQIEVAVLRDGAKTDTNGSLEVSPARSSSASYLGYILFPPVTIVLFAVRERLIRRRSKTK